MGHAIPRIAPPRPLHSRLDELQDEAACLGIDFMPWQDNAGTYIEAVDAAGKWLYAEVPVVVGRQNGKTEILVPHICRRMRMGRRMMHTAQNRELPREVFGRVADHMLDKHRGELLTKPRFANGQEEIKLRNGGRYRIVAPTRGGARGPSNDDLLIDEIRELEDHEFIAAAKPTLSASANPQTLYLSNAGTDESEVLNALKLRAKNADPGLAYLEWSASPELAPDDREGWLQSNPAIGWLPGKMENLEREYVAHSLGGTMAVFETEYLCRWQASMRERLLDEHAWARSEVVALPAMQSPVMGLAMDPGGRRASAALAWQTDDGVAVQMLFDVTGDPIDPVALGQRMKDEAAKRGVRKVGFDPLTDAELVKHFREPVSIAGGKFANATANFVTHVNGGRLRHADAAAVTDDLVWTARKPHDESGSYQAVRAKDDRPIPAALAAIRAVWLASGPTTSKPKVYVR